MKIRSIAQSEKKGSISDCYCNNFILVPEYRNVITSVTKLLYKNYNSIKRRHVSYEIIACNMIRFGKCLQIKYLRSSGKSRRQATRVIYT